MLAGLYESCVFVAVHDIVKICFVQVDSSWYGGNYEDARYNSTCSLIWNIFSIVVGIAIGIISGIVIIST